MRKGLSTGRQCRFSIRGPLWMRKGPSTGRYGLYSMRGPLRMRKVQVFTGI